MFRKLRFLIKTDAPLWVIAASFWLNLTHLATRRKYDEKLELFKLEREQLELDHDWLTLRLYTWFRVFDRQNLYARKTLQCLEIGSWQGLSAYFLLGELPNAELTCVDTWEGADEHKFAFAAGEPLPSNVETIFDSNLSAFGSRLRKYKGTSFSYFENTFAPNTFDFIYVDGSHHSDDVIVDAIKGFEMLKVGGVMIFDDYFWRFYKRKIDNPAGALNAFLRMKKHQLQIIGFDYQLVVKKTQNSVRYTGGD